MIQSIDFFFFKDMVKINCRIHPEFFLHLIHHVWFGKWTINGGGVLGALLDSFALKSEQGSIANKGLAQLASTK